MFTPNALRSMTGKTFGHGAFQAHAPEIEPHPFAEVSEFVHGRPIDRNIIARTHPERALGQAWPEIFAHFTTTRPRRVLYGVDAATGFRKNFFDRLKLADSPLACAAFRHLLLNFGYYPESPYEYNEHIVLASDEVCAAFLQQVIPDQLPYVLVRGFFSDRGMSIPHQRNILARLSNPRECSIFFKFLYDFITPEWPPSVRIYALSICRGVIRENYGPDKKIMDPELRNLAYDLFTNVIVYDSDLWVTYLAYDCLYVLFAAQSFAWEFDALDVLSDRCQNLNTPQNQSQERRYYNPTRDKKRVLDELLTIYVYKPNSKRPKQ